jgi:hypothetical protein
MAEMKLTREQVDEIAKEVQKGYCCADNEAGRRKGVSIVLKVLSVDYDSELLGRAYVDADEEIG